MTTRSVALLRGVNVGGHGSLKMDALRDAFVALGHHDVRTYIQSGNVVFSSELEVGRVELGAALARELGVELAVVVRTAAELQAVLDADPFPDAPRSARHIGFCDARPREGVLDELDPGRFAPEEAAIVGSEVHLLLPDGMGRAKLPVALGRKLDVAVTYRNWNTVTKLLELCGG